MAGYGVTQDGFTIKGFDVILGENLDRARQMFGNNVDITATSAIRKILEVAAAQDAELWQHMEDLYYSNFVSTAFGDALDTLGDDLGLQRRYMFSQGEVTFKINNPISGRQYTFTEGTRVTTASSILFATTASITLSATLPQTTVSVQALERGPQGDIAAQQITGLEPVYQQIYINLGGPPGSITVDVSNAQAFQGGAILESDDDYRVRLLGWPRTMWTLESVRRAVLDVTGVIDVSLFDPLGGVDVSQSYFNLFRFNERRFSGERRLGEPYFFEMVVAHEVAWPWHTQGKLPGIYERVSDAVDLVRPIGIYANIIQADHIEVGVRATVVVEPGQDQQSLLASIRQRIARDLSVSRLGGKVLFSQVMRAFLEEPGVTDVQNMHLRRSPAILGRITFGAVPFQSTVTEAPVGENLVMGQREVAVFRIDSALIDLQVVAQ